MKVLIIEDEYLMAEDLEDKILEYDASIEIVDKLTTVQEGVAYFSNNAPPDLVFSDIQLPDGLSFDIFREVSLEVPVIFCTAYNQYALDAFKTNAIDYILKPFENEAIAQALDKHTRLCNKPVDNMPDMKSLMSLLGGASPQNERNILVHKGDKITPMKTSEVAVIMLDEGISYMYTFSGQRHQVDYSMDKLQDVLGNGFFRANRQFLVCSKAVKDVSKYFSRKLLVNITIKIDEQIIVSKAKASEFLRWLEYPQ